MYGKTYRITFTAWTNDEPNSEPIDSVSFVTNCASSDSIEGIIDHYRSLFFREELHYTIEEIGVAEHPF